MFANLDRETFIALLKKLGSADDAEALAAARDLHTKVAAAGTSWDRLLAPDSPDDDEDQASHGMFGDDDDDDEGIVLVAPNADHGALSDAEKDEARTLIATIGTLKVSDTTRDELTGYAADLLEGRMEKMDLRYLRALQKRLNG